MTEIRALTDGDFGQVRALADASVREGYRGYVRRTQPGATHIRVRLVEHGATLGNLVAVKRNAIHR